MPRHQLHTNPSTMCAQNISAVLSRDDVFIVPTRDGSNTLFSRAYNTSYHSLFGAVAESKHVFLQHGLHLADDRPEISVLEFGFGTGLNAFLAYLFAINREKPVAYTGIEAFPIEPSLAVQLDYPYYLSYPEEGDIFLRMHEEESFASGPFTFQKIASVEDLSPEMRVDCIFFDAFAPLDQPGLWEQTTFEALLHLLHPGGALVTYCAQGEVRRRMARAGFDIQRLPGPPGKREMLRAVRPV